MSRDVTFYEDIFPFHGLVDDSKDTQVFPELPTVNFPDVQAHGGQPPSSVPSSSVPPVPYAPVDPQTSSGTDFSAKSSSQPSLVEEDHSTDEDFADAEPDYQEESNDDLPQGDELDDHDLPPRNRKPPVWHKDCYNHQSD
ncbi:unnamed protein product [Linum trigynum]|uniref:Uncharacterized protein n=1 Tax=Linum trigynum TaxID=586398 RepID=A0AAV2CZY6_9ROSI